jgi:hypothetical protein
MCRSLTGGWPWWRARAAITGSSRRGPVLGRTRLLPARRAPVHVGRGPGVHRPEGAAARHAAVGGGPGRDHGRRPPVPASPPAAAAACTRSPNTASVTSTNAG